MLRRTTFLTAVSVAIVAVSTPAAADPDDALLAEQWAFSPATVFDLPAAWQLSQGAGVVVAVVDSGIKLDHPDLASNLWTNAAEVPGNRVDDDGNGYVDDVHGVDLTGKGTNSRLRDGFGHGTHVAGTIAAAANRRGVVGVAFRAKLMAVKVLDDRGAGTTGAVAEGIRYAAANGARIINLSLETTTDDPRVHAAVAAAAAANALVITSAGNSGTNVDRKPIFPVSIAAPNVVGVAATEPNDGRSLPDFSNYGRLTVPVAAPGVDVLSTSRKGGYERKSGTSMAAPHVTGVAALMAAVAPNLSAADLRAILLQQAERTAAPVGSGYVDALDSVLSASQAASYDMTQLPRVRVLKVTREGRDTRALIAVLGASEVVTRLVVELDGRKVATVRGGRRVVQLSFRAREGRRLSVVALAADGRTLARASGPVRDVRPAKRGARSGGAVSAWQ